MVPRDIDKFYISRHASLRRGAEVKWRERLDESFPEKHGPLAVVGYRLAVLNSPEEVVIATGLGVKAVITTNVSATEPQTCVRILEQRTGTTLTEQHFIISEDGVRWTLTVVVDALLVVGADLTSAKVIVFFDLA